MALEACMLYLDGSEYMRNGDYTPTRMDAMKDAANLICKIKTDMNPETTVGLVAGGYALGPKVLCSGASGQEMNILLNACTKVGIGSDVSSFSKAVQVASLALKHRRNKNAQQRIVAFVGSPVTDDEEKLIKLAKNLKKNNVAVDVVIMGEFEQNEHKLQVFIENVDKSGNSHLVVVPAGALPSEVVMSSPIIIGSMGGEEGGAGAGAAAAAYAEYGGVDPNLDPELAMALRASLEEHRARTEAAEEQPSATTADASQTQTAQIPPETPKPPSGDTGVVPSGDADEDELLLQALAMSLQEGNQLTSQEAGKTTNEEGEDAEDEDEEARQLALALAMSQEEDADAQKASQAEASAGTSAAGFHSADYVKELMEGLGDEVDLNDPQIRQLMQQFEGGDQKQENKKQKKDDEDSK